MSRCVACLTGLFSRYKWLVGFGGINICVYYYLLVGDFFIAGWLDAGWCCCVLGLVG